MATRKTATKSASTKPAGKPAGKSASKRELIAANGDKRLVRRDDSGQFKESDDLGRSLAQDARKAAGTVVKSGQGDKGDKGDRARKSK